ncbi:MAG: hypothetical protein QM599_01500 [Pseudoxanthomonas sp.]
MASGSVQPDPGIEPDWTNEVFAKLEQKGPILTFEEMDLIEERWRDDTRNRRCSLLVLAKPWVELRELVVTDKEFAIAVAQIAPIARDLSERLHSLADAIGAADIWATCALAHREDMAEVIGLAAAEACSEEAEV